MERHDHAAASVRARQVHSLGADDDRVPGAEFPAAVHLSVIVAFAWILVASWLTFGAGTEADLGLAIATLLGIVFFALPIILYTTATHRFSAQRQRLDEFLYAPVDTATGKLTGSQAWLQVLVIPLVLAFAALAIGAVRAIVA
jgi:hypothetical protein